MEDLVRGATEVREAIHSDGYATSPCEVSLILILLVPSENYQRHLKVRSSR